MMRYLLYLLLTLSLQAVSVDRSLAVSLAKDAYEEPALFTSKYPDYNVSSYIVGSLHFYMLRDKERAIIVFRGSDLPSHWVTNLNITPVRYANIKGSRMHSGYYLGAKAVYARVAELLKDKREIVVVGHSLGGSIGLLFASILYDRGDKEVILYTFGMPPVGNKVFVEHIAALKHYRFVHMLDIVPKIDTQNIKKVKEILAYLEDQITDSSYEPFKNMLHFVEQIPYDFVHHSKEIELLNIVAPEKIEVSEILLMPLIYHSAENYETSIKKFSWADLLVKVLE